MNLTNTLSGRSQTRKATCFITPFIRHIPNRRIHRRRKQVVVARGQGPEAREREEWRETANGGGHSFWGDQSVLESGREVQCTALKILKSINLRALKVWAEIYSILHKIIEWHLCAGALLNHSACYRITCCKRHTICSEEEMIYFPTTKSPQQPTIKSDPK